MKTFLLPILALPLLLLPACGPKKEAATEAAHDDAGAAAKAGEFARLAFLDRNFTAAYDLFWEEGKKEVSLDRLTEVVKGMHPTGYPDRVAAVAVEPVKGKPAIVVFLDGTSGKGNFHYHITMAGSAEKGYRVAGIYRDPVPVAASKERRPLTAKPPEGKR